MKQGIIVYIVLALLGIMFVYSQFFDGGRQPAYSSEPITDSLITETYPELYKAIYSREADSLDPFLTHDSLSIRKQAWRALASTPVDSIDRYMRMALEQEEKLSWFALSMHSLATEHLRTLEVFWIENPAEREGISLVMGLQGDELTLEFLLDRMEQAADSSFEYACALAIGRLMVDHNLGPADHKKVIERAFLSDRSELIRAYLYGFYRGNAQEMTDETKSMLYGLWKEYGLGTSTEVDQYIAGILGGDVFYEIVLYQNSENELDQHIQLAIELAQSVADIEINERNVLATRILLMHDNPHVAQQTLVSLNGRINEGGNLYNFVTSEIVSDSLSDSFVWLEALKTVSEVNPELISEYEDRLNKISGDRPYLLPQVLQILQISDNPVAYLDRLGSIIEAGNSLRCLAAVNALTGYWKDLSGNAKTVALVERVREVIFKALELNDRGVAFAAGGLLANDELFVKDDFQQINDALSTFRLPEDIEVYQAFGGLYKQRFEEQAEPVIDSLASLGYVPLNRSLKQAGWDIEVPKGSETEFRTPNWNRLWKIGSQPVWVLETKKGVIKVQMKTLSAPATVSAIDSLSLAGAYNGVPFHRIVPNFVIQGGDIERQDGFGGPDFIIPTEASETEFGRGAAGIASAGIDTEGSQYFFMHQWKPHLNGRYTLFGNVIEGMDVVDRILPGDKVLNAYWQ